MKNGPDILLTHGGKKYRFSRDWITRPFFGILLAAIAISFLFAGPEYVAVLVILTAVFAAREWHRIIQGGQAGWIMALTSAGVFFALAAFLVTHVFTGPLAVLLVYSFAVWLVQRLRRRAALWHAAGVLYFGIPAVSMVALRSFSPHGDWLILGLFLAVWATDTGALVVGNLLKGPKMAPQISPNKTWSGAIGGVVAAALTLLCLGWAIGGSLWGGALTGAVLAVFAHLGDLFESMFKRKFQVKDSSDLIPGHGGALDRIDSLLAASFALALAVFLFHLNVGFLLGVRS